MMDENTEISKERQRAARLRQEVDMARHESAKHLEQLEELKVRVAGAVWCTHVLMCCAVQDEFNELQLEARQPAREETPLMRRIRQLENRCVGLRATSHCAPRDHVCSPAHVFQAGQGHDQVQRGAEHQKDV